MYLPRTALLISVLLILAVIGCTSNAPPLDGVTSEQDSAIPFSDSESPAVSLPVELPADALQPWERLDPGGFAVPMRHASGINEQSDYTQGIARFTSGGTVDDVGQTSRITSGAPGGGSLSYAVYRVPLGGMQPGVVSADVNLRLRSDSSPSEYWLGLANYTSGAWEWHGPFSDGHVRISTGTAVRDGTTYLSPLGNAFFAVAGFDGADFDVVGLGVNPYDIGDLDAPPAPAGLTVAPRAGALELQWNSVLDADLAGYRVHHGPASFSSAEATGVVELNYIKGETRHLLSGISGETFVRLTAVDVSGNESALSEIVSGTPLAGSPPALEVTVDTAYGLLFDAITLTASGANTYDFDLDGDGAFEIAGTAVSAQLVDTSGAGIVRPAVRGSLTGGDAVAMGAVSLLISKNSPPVAVFAADRYYAYLDIEPTQVLLIAEESYDPEGSALEYYFDLEGSGTYIQNGLHSIYKTYIAPGNYLVRVRVVDDQGQAAYDSILIKIYALRSFEISDPTNGWGRISIAEYEGRPALSFYNTDPKNAYFTYATNTFGSNWYTPMRASHVAGFNGEYNSLAIVDGLPAIAYYNDPDTALMYVRAVEPVVNEISWDNRITVDNSAAVGSYCTLTVVNGSPAISYYNDTTKDLMYVKATNSTGATAGDWGTPIPVDSVDNVGKGATMEIVALTPAIAYENESTGQLMYVRATDTNGNLWPTPVVAYAGPTDIGTIDLEVVDGRPAICFYEANSANLMYVRATDATGTAWPAAQTLASSDDVGSSCSMKVFEGRPAIVYLDMTWPQVLFMWAEDAAGSAWPDPYMIDNWYSGGNCALGVINGKPIIAHHSSEFRLMVTVPSLE